MHNDNQHNIVMLNVGSRRVGVDEFTSLSPVDELTQSTSIPFDHLVVDESPPHLTTLCRYAECRYTECQILFIVRLNVIMLNVAKNLLRVSVVILNVSNNPSC
jgi:hypothetical protein